MAAYHSEYITDLASPPVLRQISHQFVIGDKNAYTFTALVCDSADPEASLMGGTVSGSMLRPDGSTVPLEGEKGDAVQQVRIGGIECNATPCSITLPSACFAYPGRVVLTIKLVDSADDSETQVLVVSGIVNRTSTDAIVDPGEIIPDVETLMSAAAEALEAAAAAEEAAEYVDDLMITIEQSKSVSGMLWSGSGFYRMDTKAWDANLNYQASQYLPCWPGDVMIVYGNTSLSNACSVVTFLDKDRNAISVNNNLGTDFTEISITVPANAVYVRIGAKNEYLDRTYIKYPKPIGSPLYRFHTSIIDCTARVATLESGAEQHGTEIAQLEHDVANLTNQANTNGFVHYSFPEDFTWTSNPVADKITTDGKGRFRVDFNVMDHISTDGLDVYMATDGSDANDGLTPETPKLTLAAAIGITNARRVHIAGGHYPRQVFTGSAKIAKDIDLIGDPDNRPIFTSQDASVAWTAAAVDGVYTTAHKNNAVLLDLTTIVSGFYRAYTAESSTANVEANAGTYYDDGTTVTIHTFDDAEPTLASVCYTQKRAAMNIATAGYQILLANLRFTCGGTYSSEGQLMITGDSSLRGTFLIYNCDSSYGTRPTITPGTPPSGGGFMTSYADAVIQECSAYYMGNDGFSYGSSSRVVEIGCVSAFNGVSEATSCNGSTAHGGSYIRINGAYHDTHGPVVHDVGATESVNLGLAAWHSTCEGKPNFCASGGYVKMWLDSCVGYSSDAGIDVGKPDEPAANAVIYKRNCTSDVADGEYGGHIYRY